MQCAVLVEEFAGAVGTQPVGEHLQMLGGVPGAGKRHLVCPPRSGGLLAVDVGRTGPALGVTEDDHRPAWPGLVTGGRPCLDRGDLVEDVVEQFREPAVDVGMVRGAVVDDLEEVRIVTVTHHQAAQFVLRDAIQHSRIGDLVAVEMQNGQHHAVFGGVHELVGVPTGGQCAGLGLAVADDRRDEQVGVVERRTVGM